MDKYVEISSIAEFLEVLFCVEKCLDKSIPCNKEILLFRGHSNSEFLLMPTVGRNRQCSMDISMLDEERNLIELAKYRLPKYFHSNMEPIELLSLLQHFGIPTRLLDVTSNALAALFFACESNKNMDGEVIVFRNNESNIVNYPIVNALADSYRFLNGTFGSLKSFYKNVSKQIYFLEQLNLCDNADEAEDWIKKVCEKPIFIYAPIHTERQRSQQGQYILFPNKIEVGNEKAYFTKVIAPISKDHDCVVKRIIIKKTYKEQIIKQLSICGINIGSLFPDNPDIICKQITQECKEHLVWS